MQQGQFEELDPQRQELAKAYARERRRLLLIELLISGLYISIWVFSGLGIRVREALESIPVGRLLPVTQPWWFTLLLFTLIFALPNILLTLPISFYSGYTLPHRYEMSTRSISGWILDQLKSALLGVFFGVPLLLGLYALIRSLPGEWWFPAALLYSFLTIILTTLAPVLVMPIFYKFEPLGSEHAALAERLAALAERSGTRIRGVFTMDMSRRTRAANAALVGIGRTRRIILGDTLLDKFSVPEVEIVLAHEFGHHVHKDIQLGIAIQSLLNLVLFYLASAVLNLAVQRIPLQGEADLAGLPVILLAFGLLGFLTTPLNNAYSRWRERMADDFALRSTRLPGAFASAMTRLANQNLADVNPPRWVVFLFGTHPPLLQRIAHARTFLLATHEHAGNEYGVPQDPAGTAKD